MDKLGIFFGIVLALLVVALCVSMMLPSSRAAINEWQHDLHKIDDATTYKTRKQVEDTCRATIVSYEADKLTWLQYKDSESDEQRGWADAARLRANKAAVTYNEYILKNSYVFEGNVPGDILAELPLIE